MSYDDYGYYENESYNYQIDEEQLQQLDRQEAPSSNAQQYIQIVDPNKCDDAGFDYLLTESNISQLEETLFSDTSMYYYREAKLFNLCANILQMMSNFDPYVCQEYAPQLQKLLKFFFQIHYIGQHSEYNQLLAKQYGIDNFSCGYPIGFKINSNNQLIKILLNLILSEEMLQSDNDPLSPIRLFLPRFFIFSLNPPPPFVAEITIKQLQTQAVNIINNDLLDSTFDKPLKLDILALTYFSEPTQNIVAFKEVTEILGSIFESLLDQKNKSDVQAQLVNLLQFFLAFTTNQIILQQFFNNQFHKTLYNAIKFSQTIFGCMFPPKWSKEPMVIDAMVSLIVRIVSVDRIDKTFLDILLDDFTHLLQKQKFDLLYKVLLPILNSENVNLIPVCFHPKMTNIECRQQIEKFLQTQNKTMVSSTRLLTEALSKAQSEKINQLIISQLVKYPQAPKPVQMELEQQQFVNLFNEGPQEILQQFQPPIQQGMEIETQQQSIKGSWVHLHQFSASNPHFDSNILTKVLDNRLNVLFIFDIMAGTENVKLVCFIDHLIQDQKRQNFIQAKSNETSFYVMMVQDDHFWHVKSLDGKPHILLDIQHHMFQISHHNKPIACINFQDLQQCKFGFLFEKLQPKNLLMDQINAALQGEECFLLGIEMWTFDTQKDCSDRVDVASLITNKNYQQQLNYYLSQFRFQNVFFVPSNITLQDLNLAINENIPKLELKENEINDIQVEKPVKQFDVKIPQRKPLLTYFQQHIGGIQKIIEYINKHLFIDQADQVFKNFFIELQELCEIEGFQEEIVNTEGFLQLILAVAYLNKSNEGKEAYNKGIQFMYTQLAKIIEKSPVLKREAILKHRFHQIIITKIDQYLNILNGREQPQFQLKFEQPKLIVNKQQAVNKGKPKGIGYGDIGYKAPVIIQQQKQEQVQDKNNKPSIEIQEDQQEINLTTLLNCLASLLDQELDSKLLESLSKSSLMKFLTKYIANVNITSVEGSKVFKKVTALIENLAQREQSLSLFIDQESCLFKQMESISQQAIIFLKTFQTKVEEINEFLRVYNYVENSLYAADLIEIKYLAENQIEQQQDNIKLHQFYHPFMKKLAVGKCQIKDDAQYLAVMKEYYQQSGNPAQAKMQKILSEISTIEDNLPLEATNSIFIRYDSDRIDCMRTLIFGASGTPYAHGAFLYEMFFGDDYPTRPPKMKLSTTGHGKVRFNPNLYNCGKVCLSLLGTWGDNWIANFSTILQILVSVQSMVMSEYVMFNEPGWESQMGTPNGEAANRGYCNFIKVQNIRYAMIEQLQKPPKGFEEVIKKSFYLRKDLIKKEIESWIEQANLPATYNQTQNQCTYATSPDAYKNELKKVYDELVIELDKLKFNVGTDFQTISNEKKKNITIKPQGLLQPVQLLANYYPLPQGLDIKQIDISYEQQFQQKSFDSNDSNVQNLMSRYIGVVGLDAVKKQSEATVFIHQMNGLGIEIAKNIVLSGVKQVIIFDPVLVTQQDLGTNFYLTQQDIGNRRDMGVINRLRHLNPYVKIEMLQRNLSELKIDEVQVFITQDPQVAIQASQIQKVAVILAQTRGISTRIVTDFGNQFTLLDKDGEAPSEVNIEKIESKLVTLFKNQTHNFNDGDRVLIQEVQENGPGNSHNQIFEIKNVKRFSFELISDLPLKKYISHGIAYQQKKSVTLSFNRIETVLNSLNYFSDGLGALDQINEIKRDLTHFCLNITNEDQLTQFWIGEKFKSFVQLIRQQNIREILHEKYKDDVFLKHQDQLLHLTSLASINGQLAPLCALVGGLASQEALKAINRKYTPIHQVYVQCFDDLLPFKLIEMKFISIGLANQLELNNIKFEQFINQFGYNSRVLNRYSDTVNILGQQKYIYDANVFVVGAGAIGCELIKNYAMIGLGKNGKIYVTDPDIIENSNLSRQFLFREKHIRKPKSLTAAAVALSMNPELNIVARLDKVCPESQDIYHNIFYKKMQCVTNALDNVNARLYVDSRCVENHIPLIESGTLGPKGHVQVIIPFKTESYASKQDPEQSTDIPYCTLKMFPETNIHCLEWGRDKFEQYFFRKPQALFSVLNDSQPQQQALDLAIRVLKKYPINFQHCVTIARLKFEKLFVIDIQQLLTAYPLNSLTKEGKLFWSAPKRPPQPIQFRGEWAVRFVQDFALLTAQVYGVQIPNNYNIVQMIQQVIIPEKSNKQNKIKEIVEKQQDNKQQQQQEEVKNYEQLKQEASKLLQQVRPKIPNPQQFEKDDDTNHHVSFITAATNGRAQNYGIAQVDWMWTKLKAGRIIPAMATTTSCIAALQTIELIKILQQGTDQYRNTFLNLAIPFLMQSEPGEVEKFKLNGLEVSFWTQLDLKIKKWNEPLKYIISRLEQQIGQPILALQQGAKALYVLQMLPKDEEEKYKVLNVAINRQIQINSNQALVEALLADNKTLRVKISV